MSLTADDRRWVDLLFQFGPARLIDEGFSVEERDAFLQRDDVRDEVRRLAYEYQTQEHTEARVKYATRRRLFNLAPRAVGVLEDAMNGVRYARDDYGNIIFDSYSNPILLPQGADQRQLRAAEMVLEMLGISPDTESIKVEVNVAALLQQERTKLAIAQDTGLKSDEEKGIARERVRVAMEKLTKSSPELVKRALAETGVSKKVQSKVIDAASKSTKKRKASRRKKTTKKTTKKKGAA